MRPENFSSSLSYIASLYAPEDALLADVSKALPEAQRGMQVSAVEGKLLALCVQMIRAERVLEIGTCVGYSALWMARALPASGVLHTIERSAEHAALARSHFAKSEVAARIILHEGDASEILSSLLDACWDLVFIDADKAHYPRYLDYAQTHVRSGGLILADNTLLFGAMAGDAPRARVSSAMREGMEEFNVRLADSTRFTSILLPTAEGLSVALVK